MDYNLHALRQNSLIRLWSPDKWRFFFFFFFFFFFLHSNIYLTVILFFGGFFCCFFFTFKWSIWHLTVIYSLMPFWFSSLWFLCIVSEFDRVISELRSAHLYPELELLLVACQMTFIYKELWCGELVLSSCQGGKLSYTILCTVSSGKYRIWKFIPIFNLLGKSDPSQLSVLAIGIWETCEWRSLQCLIWGIRSYVAMLSVPFRRLYIYCLSSFSWMIPSYFF